MPVQITIKGNEKKSEYQDALVLKKIFENGIPDYVEGKILIISNATLFGQAVKDVDLIVIGTFNRYKARIFSNTSKNQEVYLERDTWVNNFCFVFETKKHNATDILMDGLTLKVKYNDKYHDATIQSEEQKYALKKFFENTLHVAPYVYNFIWLRSISEKQLRDLTRFESGKEIRHNILTYEFNTQRLYELACLQRPTFETDKGESILQSLKKDEVKGEEQILEAFSLFERVKQCMGNLTRRKINILTEKFLDNQQYAQSIGAKLTVISGKAGTGKTVKLLHLACDQALNSGKRCLILTFNHSLISDIRRTLALMDMPDGIENGTVKLMTLHQFFYDLFLAFGIATGGNYTSEMLKNRKFVSGFIEQYDFYLEQLSQYIKEGLIQKKVIQSLMYSRHECINWDYLLIDESQDWKEIEKDILFQLFGNERVVISESQDQLVRNDSPCEWVRNIQFQKTTSNIGLRQKKNLVEFVTNYAEKFDLNWNVSSIPNFLGGKVIITNRLDFSLFHTVLSDCKKMGNAAYDMLFLVPPGLVTGRDEARCFSLTEEFNKNELFFWDGTKKNERFNYPDNVEHHRLLQYESCRGLEGWTVVCLEFDEFIKYKMNSYVEKRNDANLRLIDPAIRKDKAVYLWSLIPLTRAIDTLIITINDLNSDVAKRLKILADENPAYIVWRV